MSTQQNRPFVTLTGAITMILGMVVLFYLAKGIFTILALVAPVLIILTLIINHKVVVNYGKWIFNQYREQNWPVALGATALTFFAFPFVSLFLFGKALIMKKITESFPEAMEQHRQTSNDADYVEYEEIVEDPLELPEISKEAQEKIDKNDYENLF